MAKDQKNAAATENGKGQKRTALITGASSGIGADLAREFAAGGHDLVLVARTEPKLRALGEELARDHEISYHVITADLAQPGAAAEVVRQVSERGITVDVLVNNAGYGLYGHFIETDMDYEMSMIQVNVIALVQLSKLLMPGMVARKYGRILNVASTAAFQPGPLMAVYYATKAFVLSLSEALANETLGTGVTVTALCPGPTKSGFQSAAKMEESKLVRGKDIMDSVTVAKAGYQAAMKGRAVIIPGVANKLQAQAIRFLPRSTVTKIVRNVQERSHDAK